MLYNKIETDINILNWMFIMRKIAICITQFLRKSIIDTYLATRPAWISFFHGSFWFFLKTYLALLDTELHVICHFFLCSSIYEVKDQYLVKFSNMSQMLCSGDYLCGLPIQLALHCKSIGISLNQTWPANWYDTRSCNNGTDLQLLHKGKRFVIVY